MHPHLPSYVSRRLAARLGQPPPLPWHGTRDIVILFADISGFTPLAEHLAHHGPGGAEELTRLLNAYFGRMVDIIAEHGGDVFTFAGDALLAFWPGGGVCQAATCGLSIQSQLNHYPAGDGLFLSLHLGIAAGQVDELLVGGLDGRLELLVTGQPLEQMAGAEHHSKPGTVVLSNEAAAVAGDRIESSPVGDGYVQVLRSPANDAVQATSVDAHDDMALQVPRAVLDRLEAEQSDWIAEVRRVTVLFLHLLVDAPVAQLQSLHETVLASQHVLKRYEATGDQWLVDDKGTVLIAAIGLPPWTHENDAERGVRAGLELLATAHTHGFGASIGITKQAAHLDPPAQGTLVDRLPYGRRERCLGQALHGLDRLGDSRTHLEAALRLLDAPLPHAGGQAVLGSLEEVARQIQHRVLHVQPHPGPLQAEVWLEVARAYEVLLEIFFISNETSLGLYGMMRILNLTEGVSPSPELARAYASAAAVMALMRQPKGADFYIEQALAVATGLGDRSAEAHALFYRGFTAVCQARLEMAAQSLEKATVIAEATADRVTWQKSVMVQGLVAWHQGDLDGTLRHYQLVLEYVERKMRNEHRAWALIGPAQVALRQGRFEDAASMMEEARRLVGGNRDQRTGIPSGGILAVARLRQGRVDEAVAEATETARMLAAIPAGDLGALPGHVGVCETWLTLLEKGDLSRERAAREACAALRKYAAIIAIAQPMACLAQGRLDACRHRIDSARRNYQRAFDTAQTQGQRHEQAMAQQLLNG